MDAQKVKPTKLKLLPPKFDATLLMKELVAAHAAIGELKGFLNAIPNPKLLIAPFRKKEAVASSAIEGTKATFQEVMEFEANTPNAADEHTQKIDDIREVINYELAMNIALDELAKRPIGENLLKVTHGVLLNSVRGTNKNRGNFRREQVSVGEYIPPVHTSISELIDNWERYLNGSKDVDPLLRIGIAHYQFEAIHPFMDGNGRIGRLIIPLFLCQENVLQTPVLFASRFFEEHKVEYQKLLHGVDINEDWVPWLRFFLIAMESQAKSTTLMARDIVNLYDQQKKIVVSKIKSRHAIEILDLLFRQPITNAASIRVAIQAASKATTYNLVDRFAEEGIINVYGAGREKVYMLSSLMKVLRV